MEEGMGQEMERRHDSSYIYELGEGVRLLFDVVNDGTFYQIPRGRQVALQGELGHVVRRGLLIDRHVYEVHFLETPESIVWPAGDRIVGCREFELVPLSVEWHQPIFAKGEAVLAKIDLRRSGELIVDASSAGEVEAVRYLPDIGYVYDCFFLSAQYRCLLRAEQLSRA